jgi:hypothetical protein
MKIVGHKSCSVPPHTTAHHLHAHTRQLKGSKSTRQEIIASKKYYLLKKKRQELLRSQMIQTNFSLSSYPALENTFSCSELPRNICFPYPSATVHLKGCLSTGQLFEDRIGFQT